MKLPRKTRNIRLNIKFVNMSTFWSAGVKVTITHFLVKFHEIFSVEKLQYVSLCRYVLFSSSHISYKVFFIFALKYLNKCI